MALLIEYLIFIMQMLHNYEIFQIAVPESVTEAFQDIMNSSKNTSVLLFASSEEPAEEEESFWTLLGFSPP